MRRKNTQALYKVPPHPFGSNFPKGGLRRSCGPGIRGPRVARGVGVAGCVPVGGCSNANRCECHHPPSGLSPCTRPLLITVLLVSQGGLQTAPGAPRWTSTSRLSAYRGLPGPWLRTARTIFQMQHTPVQRQRARLHAPAGLPWHSLKGPMAISCCLSPLLSPLGWIQLIFEL